MKNYLLSATFIIHLQSLLKNLNSISLNQSEISYEYFKPLEYHGINISKGRRTL